MRDRLAIVVPYVRSDLARLSVYLADGCLEAGVPATLWSPTKPGFGLSPYWDGRVRRASPLGTPEDTHCSHVLWMTPPPLFGLKYVQHYGQQTWLFSSYREPTVDIRQKMAQAAAVLCPYDCVTRLVRETVAGTARLLRLTITPPAASIHKHELSSRRYCYFPLGSRQMRKIGPQAIWLMRQMLLRDSRVYVVLPRMRGWRSVYRSAIVALRREYPHRIGWLPQPFIYCDLVVWPLRHDPLALPCLEAAAAGAVTIAWDAPPQRELLDPAGHGLVPVTTVRKSTFGLQTVRDGMEHFLDATLALLQDEMRFARLRATAEAAKDACDRRALFTSSITKLFT